MSWETWQAFAVRTVTGQLLALHATSFSASKHISALRKWPGLASGKAEWVDVRIKPRKVAGKAKR